MNMKRVLSIILTIMIVFTITSPDAQAAVRKPARVTWSKCSAAQTSISLRWKKAKYAKKYEIYQLVGKKFKKIRTSKARRSTIKKLKAGKTYKFKVRAVNGRKKGKLSKVKTIRTKNRVVKKEERTAGDVTVFDDDMNGINEEYDEPYVFAFDFESMDYNIELHSRKKLKLKFIPENAKDHFDVTYSSSDPLVVKIVNSSNEGVEVEGLKTGSSLITATCDGKDKVCIVAVNVSKVAYENVPAGWTPSDGFEQFGQGDEKYGRLAYYGYGSDKNVIDSIYYYTGITENSSDVDKARAVAEWLSYHMSYSHTSRIRQGECYHYSLLYAYILNNYYGIETKITTSFIEEGDHAWNIVKCDGEKFAVDVTWMDRSHKTVMILKDGKWVEGEKVVMDYSDPDNYEYDYFLKSSEYLSEKDSKNGDKYIHSYDKNDEWNKTYRGHTAEDYYSKAECTKYDNVDWRQSGVIVRKK